MKLKTHTSIVVSTLLLLTVIACSEAPSSKAEKKEIKTIPTAFTNIKSVPLSEATLAILNYGNWCRSLNLTPDELNNVTRAFLIPGNDLIGVLQPNTPVENLLSDCNYNQARAYIGLDSNNVLHLYLTPVNEEGQDVILSNPTNGEQHVFDLTSPCPNTCDAASELYNAFN